MEIYPPEGFHIYQGEDQQYFLRNIKISIVYCVSMVHTHDKTTQICSGCGCVCV